MEVATGIVSRLVTEVDGRVLSARDPACSPDGSRIAFVAPPTLAAASGRLLEVEVTSGAVSPFIADSVRANRPAYAPDGGALAFFVESEDGALDLAVADRGGPVRRIDLPQRSAQLGDQSRHRVLWKGGNELLYSAAGRLWSISPSGGAERQIPFRAALHVPPPPENSEPPLHIPEPGERVLARGFGGLALAPGGDRFAILALDSLWIVDLAGTARAVTAVPADATGLAWSRDEREIAWSAGPPGEEDLFATSLVSGATRQLTRLPGQEVRPAWSPDGRSLAFVHHAGGAPQLRVAAPGPTETRDTLDAPSWGGAVGSGPSLESWPQWSPDGTALLLHRAGGPLAVLRDGAERLQVPLRETASFVRWGPDGDLVFVSENRLWSSALDRDGGTTGEPRLMASDASTYPTLADDGSVLFVGEKGLVIRRPDGRTAPFGWPLGFHAAGAEPLVIRNAMIFDPRDGSYRPGDIHVEGGRIRRIADAGIVLPAEGANVVDAAGRIALPGLIDLHAHLGDGTSLPGQLYHGVTSIREMGGDPVARSAALRDEILAGLRSGPRVLLTGMQLNPGCVAFCWANDASQQLTASAAEPAIALSQAFGADWLKMYMPHTTRGAARFLDHAAGRQMRVGGHVARHEMPTRSEGWRPRPPV